MRNQPQPPKIKNLISFGKQKQPEPLNLTLPQQSFQIPTPSPHQNINVRCEDSYSFDFGKEATELGLEVVSLSERSIVNQNGGDGAFGNGNANGQSWVFNSDKGRLRNFLLVVRDCLGQLRNSVEVMRKQYIKYMQKINADYLVNIEKLVAHQQLQNLSQSLLFPLNYPNLTLNSAFSISLPPSSSLASPSFQRSCLEIQNKSLQTEVQILKKQLLTLTSLNQKRQLYHKERLHLKQLQWERRINQIMREYGCGYIDKSQGKGKEKEKEKEKDKGRKQREWEYGASRKEDKFQWQSKGSHKNPGKEHSQGGDQQIFGEAKSLRYSRNKRVESLGGRDKWRSQTESNQLQSCKMYNLKGSIQKALNNSLSPRYNQKINLSNNRFIKISPQNSIDRQEKIEQKLKYYKQRDRKFSTDYDYSFTKVNQKIKNFQSNIKRQIQNISKN